ncbi:ankyrin repeat-containing domain protein [Nemania abortiva]|nr:ankyrin repeat-containing domain protein [Nemania abortiva]
MAPDDWERHKATILSLFLLEKLSLQKVASYMQEKHNFVKNKSQYEYKLKKWGVKKKLSKEFWRYVDHQMKKRKGKKTEVTLFGVVLSEQRIHRERLRYAAIPSAKDFGRSLASPSPPSGDIVRFRTPSIVGAATTWSSQLPWFQFSFVDRILPTLSNPAALLQTFFSSIGSDVCFLGNGNNAIDSIYSLARDPLELHKAMLQLTNLLPNDPRIRHEEATAIENSGSPLSIVSAMLKVVLYQLSNKIAKFHIPDELHRHDKFVLHLVEAVSRTNPESLSTILSGECLTTQTIREAVYGCAIRAKDYGIVSQLLRSGVDPNLLVQLSPTRTVNLDIEWREGCPPITTRNHWYVASGLEEAAFTCDMRLGEILLQAGANANNSSQPQATPLIISAFESGYTDKAADALEYTRRLVDHGAMINPPVRQCPSSYCKGAEILSPLSMAISRHSNRLARFFLDKGAWTDLSGRFIPTEECPHCKCFWDNFLNPLGIACSPLQLAIASGNTEMTKLLIQPVLASPMYFYQTHIAQQLLVTSCLVGDLATASRLLDSGLDLNTAWKLGVSPLVATSWNPDTTIAESLLKLGVHVGPNRTDAVFQTSMLCPIHVAARHGITKLVQQLIENGADCNASLDTNSSSRIYYGEIVLNLLPTEKKLAAMNFTHRYSTSLQFAIMSGNVNTIRLLLPSSDLVGGELVQAIDLGDDSIIDDLIARGASLFDTIKDGRTVLDAAAETGNLKLILLYFTSKGCYRSIALYFATQAAVKSDDYSIIRFLVTRRPSGPIDSHEASCLVLSIRGRVWDLAYLFLNDPFLPGEARSFYDSRGLINYNPHFEYHHPNDTGVGVTPLSVALLSSNTTVVKLMAQRGYSLQPCDVVALSDVWDELHAILDTFRSAVWPERDMSLQCKQLLLLRAIKSNDMGHVRKFATEVGPLNYYIDPDKSVHFPDVAFGNPLEQAVRAGNIETVRFLINVGSDVNWQIPSGERALDLATTNDVVEVLLSYGAAVNPPTQLDQGATALQYAAIHGDLNLARILIDRGADINAPPAKSHGRTALEGAAEWGNIDMVQFLLGSGAELEGKMRAHFVRSVRLARDNGHSALADSIIMQSGPWTPNDELLYNAPSILEPEVVFLYDKESYQLKSQTETYHPFRFPDPIVYYDKESALWHVRDEEISDCSFPDCVSECTSASSCSGASIGSIEEPIGVAGGGPTSPEAMILDTLETGGEMQATNFDLHNAAESTADHYYVADQFTALEARGQEMEVRGVQVPDFNLEIPAQADWQGFFSGVDETYSAFDI